MITTTKREAAQRVADYIIDNDLHPGSWGKQFTALLRDLRQNAPAAIQADLEHFRGASAAPIVNRMRKRLDA